MQKNNVNDSRITILRSIFLLYLKIEFSIDRANLVYLVMSDTSHLNSKYIFPHPTFDLLPSPGRHPQPFPTAPPQWPRQKPTVSAPWPQGTNHRGLEDWGGSKRHPSAASGPGVHHASAQAPPPLCQPGHRRPRLQKGGGDGYSLERVEQAQGTNGVSQNILFGLIGRRQT